MALSERIESLKSAYCEKGVLTIYLNTMRTNSEWKLRLKNGLKKLEEYIEARGNKTELKDYMKLKKQILKEIKDQQLNLQKSIVVFASVDKKIWELHHLQLKVENEFCWEEKPIIEQLADIQKQYPSRGIIVVQQKEVLAIDMSLGEVSDESYFTLDVEAEDWRKYEGTAATERKASGSNQKDRFEDRVDVQINRSLKGLAPIIDQLAKTKRWQGVYMVGQPELVEEVKKHIRTGLVKVIPKNLYNKSSHQIVGEVLA